MQRVIERIVERARAELLNLTFHKSEKCKGFNEGVHKVLEIIQDEAKNGGWIYCSERMPEDGQDVLVWFEYFRYGEYNGLYQTHGIGWAWRGEWSGFVNGQSGWHKLRVIAWQPLPEQPEEEMEEWKEQ